MGQDLDFFMGGQADDFDYGLEQFVARMVREGVSLFGPLPLTRDDRLIGWVTEVQYE